MFKSMIFATRDEHIRYIGVMQRCGANCAEYARDCLNAGDYDAATIYQEHSARAYRQARASLWRITQRGV